MTPEVVFNPFDPEFVADPYPTFRKQRAHCPVFVGPMGMVFVFGYDDVSSVLRDPSLSIDDRNATNSLRMIEISSMFREWAERGAHSILNLDPPDHTRLRRLLAPAFAPRTIARLHDRVDRIIERTLDRLADAERTTGEPTELIDAFASHVPFTVISDLLGVPTSGRDELLAWSHTLTLALEPMVVPDDVEAIRHAGDSILARMTDLIAWKRSHPADDLLTSLLMAEDDGDTLSELELVDQVSLMYIAGHETVVNLLGNGVWHLLRHRAQFERLTADATLAANAVEEILRFDSPIQFARRIPLADAVVGGQTVAAGSTILLGLASANRDDARFGPDADVFDVTRSDAADHLSLGSGIHYCLGAALARLEGTAALASLARRFPDMALVDGHEVRNGRMMLRGFDRLPVRLVG